MGGGWLGGRFRFLDPEEDLVVAPRTGRLLTFTAGLENLHRAVSAGVSRATTKYSDKHANQPTERERDISDSNRLAGNQIFVF